jgi:hypothetical protein
MKTNPYLYSLYAEIYIMAIALVLFSMQSPNTPDTIFAPILALSMFVLSAAVMGYLFLSKPFQLYLDGHKQGAITFFMKTVSGFALITLIVFIVVKFCGV